MITFILTRIPCLGRNVLRAALVRSDIQVVAINHTCLSVEDLVYLIRYDSSMGDLDERTDIQIVSDSLITIDGLRADWSDGWGLVRASNTTPVLVLRFEADNQTALKRIQQVFRKQLLAVDFKLKMPF